MFVLLALLLGAGFASAPCAHAGEGAQSEYASADQTPPLAAAWGNWWSDFVTFLRDRNRLILFLTLGMLLGLFIMLRR